MQGGNAVNVCARGSRWSVNYFFYNKQLKKLAFFACWIKSKFRGREDDEMRFLPLLRRPQPLDPSPRAPDSWMRAFLSLTHSPLPPSACFVMACQRRITIGYGLRHRLS